VAKLVLSEDLRAWFVWVSGPGADYERYRVAARTWHAAGLLACEVAAVRRGTRPDQYRVEAIRLKVGTEPPPPRRRLVARLASAVARAAGSAARGRSGPPRTP